MSHAASAAWTNWFCVCGTGTPLICCVLGATSMQHYETSGLVQASAERIFDHLDDHSRLSSHMTNPSWKMGWSRMTIEVDEGLGRKVGSRIRLAGRVLGIGLSVEEVVTERARPARKVWETTGEPHLLVISDYRMGFELSQTDTGAVLRVFIEYALPQKGFARWLGGWFGRSYARWCTEQMVKDAVERFRSPA